MLTTRTPEAAKMVRERFAKLRSDGQWTPPSLEGTIVFPGFDGGGEWGGAAFDPETRLLYVNANDVPWILRLVPKVKGGRSSSGRRQYQANCANCHGEDLAGSPPNFPTLRNLESAYTEEKLIALMKSGVGRMPAFKRLSEPALKGIAKFVLTGQDATLDHRSEFDSLPDSLKYSHDGYNKFLDPDGYPAVQPPWGTLTAIHLDTGKFAWRIPFGEIPALVKQGVNNTGSENYGGPIVTKNGLLFIAATNFDNRLRIFDKKTGKLLWQDKLPFAGNATPAMYEVNGKQYLVIAAGGGKSGEPSGGVYVAYSLP
jgi:quinoprotein glucose dehydrogenase